MKNSKELILLAKEIMQKELQRSIEKEKQPSFYECIYEAYISGIADASNIDKTKIEKAQDWHYIELEGLPEKDGKYWVMFKFGEKSTDCQIAEFEKDKDYKWELYWYPHEFKSVVAWYPLPEISN